MSVCDHDPNCPGHGPTHDQAATVDALVDKVAQAQRVSRDTARQLLTDRARQILAAQSRVPVVGPSRDRSMPGKARRRARKADQ